LRIAIDCTAAVRQGGGVGRYTRGLVEALAGIDRRSEYVLFMAGGGAGSVEAWRGEGLPVFQVAGFPANFHLRAVPLSNRVLAILWHRLGFPLPVEIFTGGVDIFHSPDFVLPPVRGAKTIVTVHDLSFMRTPQCAPSSLRAYLNKVVPRSVGRADMILADSQNTRRDIIALLDIAPQKTEVVPAGVEFRFRPIDQAAELERVQRRYKLERPFILSVGTLEPRKNFVGLVEAYSLLIGARNRERNNERSLLKLVIAGGKGWLYEEIFATVERLNLSERVIFPGFVADEDLPALYNLAELFAFPSFYEGFGLPALEAMACGTPVVTSNSSSLPEVVGQAGIMVEAQDTEGLAQAMERVLHDEDLRRSMSEKGLRQAKQFTWEKAVKKLLKAYERLG
jgi:glycosyltransferase involved in cell wall biosynthesis